MSPLLGDLERYAVRIASSLQDLKEAMQVRHAVYVEELGFRTAEDIADELDDLSMHFLLSIDGTPVASARMVPDTAMFEGEHYFDISSWRERGSVVELARLSVLPSHRRSLAAVALFRAFYRVAIREEIRFFFVTGASHVESLYLTLGFERIGGPVDYRHCNNTSCAYMLDLHEAVDIWRARRPRMLEHFLTPVAGIG